MIAPNSTFYMMTLEQKKTWHMALGTSKINLKKKNDFNHQYWLFNLDVLKLWHVA
jgi:hypothetical protein